MRASFLLPLLLSASFAAADDSRPSDVLDLTASTFDDAVAPEPLMLVEFFAPWCGHCKALAPHYEEAATALREKGIKLAKVDCVAEADLCGEWGVGGYPTLKVFRNGTPSDYAGNRKTEGIVSYMVKQSLPAVAEVTASNLAEFQVTDRIVLIAYVEDKSDLPASVFSSVAEEHRDEFLFGLSTDPEAIKAAGVTPPAIVLYKAFDEGKNEIPSEDVKDITEESLYDFIQQNFLPLLDEVSGDNFALYSGTKLPLAYVFLDPEDEATKLEAIESITPIAKEHKGKLNFVWIDANKYGEHAKTLNVKEPKWPAFVIQDLAGNMKYPLEQDKPMTAKAVAALASAFIKGEAQPKLKSEPAPTQEGDVFVLVGDEFEKVVFDDNKDVFVEFYAPWCGHCKRLAPTWDTLGEKYAHAKDKLTIAKMDATENDLPPSVPFQIASFPTLKFKPAGGREWVDYEGDRSLESLVEFVETSAKNSLSGVGSESQGIKADTADQAVFTPPISPHDEL